jgi:hypothetical protein
VLPLLPEVVPLLLADNAVLMEMTPDLRSDDTKETLIKTLPPPSSSSLVSSSPFFSHIFRQKDLPPELVRDLDRELAGSVTTRLMLRQQPSGIAAKQNLLRQRRSDRNAKSCRTSAHLLTVWPTIWNYVVVGVQ